MKPSRMLFRGLKRSLKNVSLYIISLVSGIGIYLRFEPSRVPAIVELGYQQVSNPMKTG